MNYKTLDKQLSGRCKNSRKIANNTYLKRRGENIAILLHKTDIATFKKSGEIVLNTGGWLTRTTKERLNRFTPVNITQNNNLWFLNYYDGYGSLFEDGMTVNKSGKPIKPINDKPLIKAMNKVNKMVNKYIKGFIADVEKNGLESPGGGDCWYCYFKTQDGETLGDKTGTGHLMQHFQDGYYTPSLLFNAIKERGGVNVGIVWSMIKNNPSMIAYELRPYFRKRKINLAKQLMEVN